MFEELVVQRRRYLAGFLRLIHKHVRLPVVQVEEIVQLFRDDGRAVFRLQLVTGRLETKFYITHHLRNRQ